MIDINVLPLPVLFFLTMVVVLVAIALGYRGGRIKRAGDAGAPEGPVGGVIGAVMGLLAFMLAFTFSIAANRFDTRKQLLLDEVNAIGTAYLRAGLLPEPHKTECRKLLKQYVDIRAAIGALSADIQEGIRECESIQKKLWSHAIDLARADMNSDIGALFVESLNEVIDLHTSRVTVALGYRVPPMIWLALFTLTFLGMLGVGYQFGLIGRPSIAASLILAISFAVVVELIADLDRAQSGFLRINQGPMIGLQKQMVDE